VQPRVLFNATFSLKIIDAFGQGLHDITVMETEVATFECQLRDECLDLEGERVWWYQGKKVEASTDKYASVINKSIH
jgi:hypothetical protein